MIEKLKSYFHIQVAGAFLVSAGVSSLVSMLGGFYYGTGASLELGFIVIFLGLQVLRGSQSYIGGILVILWLFLLSIGLILGTSLFSNSPTWPWNLTDPFQIASTIIWITGSLYTVTTLSISRKAPWFTEEKRAHPSLIWVTVILSTWFTITRILERQELEQFRPYDVEISAFDSHTKKGLSTMSLSIERDIEENLRNLPNWMSTNSISSGGSSSRGVRSMRSSGYMRDQVEITIRSDGYQDKRIIYKAGDDSHIEAYLHRKIQNLTETEPEPKE